MGNPSCINSSNSPPNHSAAGRLLLDGDNKTCLPIFPDDARFLRLMTFVYMPPYHTSYGMIINIHVADLRCNDPALLVYYNASVVSGKTIIRQCKHQQHDTSYMPDTTEMCPYLCLSNGGFEKQTVLFLQIEMVPWETHTTPHPQICELDSQNVE